jgi:hypothetical protein
MNEPRLRWTRALAYAAPGFALAIRRRLERRAALSARSPSG